MKRRVRKIANFFAFNLLFFALYLNFIHKDKRPMAAIETEQATQQNTTAFGGTVLVDNPQDYVQKKQSVETVKANTTDNKTEEIKTTAALKLSIN
jgi:hypothetical protein